jgi:hypothetical protein
VNQRRVCVAGLRATHCLGVSDLWRDRQRVPGGIDVRSLSAASGFVVDNTVAGWNITVVSPSRSKFLPRGITRICHVHCAHVRRQRSLPNNELEDVQWEKRTLDSVLV